MVSIAALIISALSILMSAAAMHRSRRADKAQRQLAELRTNRR